MITLNKETQTKLSWLLLSVFYDYDRIIIAEHEINDQELTLFLEDKQDFKSDLSECLEVKISCDEFASFIEKGNHNKYAGISYSKNGRAFDGLIVVDEPLKWYHNDATTFQRKTVLEDLVEQIIKQVVGV